MASKKTIRFEASARLQSLIGRGLIPNEEMAIVELVKNSYDSGARTVRILIQPDQPKEPSFIRVSDDGSGMSETDIRRLFMFAGYSEREKELTSAKRTPTGEKGIGRFATDKLGRTLDVFTKKANNAGLHLSIDWRDFDVKGTEKFSDIEAVYELQDVSSKIPGKSGTVLEIRRLSRKWETRQVDELAAWLGDLLNPYSTPKDFSIELEVAGSRRGIIAINPIAPTGDISMEMSVASNRVQTIIRQRGSKATVVDGTAGSAADLNHLRGLRAHFTHFDRRPKKGDTHGRLAGVRVYRDGFRIEPFGSRTADWLHISEARAKRAGHAHIVPNRLFGFVEISRRRNPELGDTTSRQALLDSDALRSLVTVLREGLVSLGQVLKTRKEPRWRENRRRAQAELEQARLHTLGEVASGLAHELRQPLQSIRSEADNIREKLRILGIDDPDIADAQESIDRGIVRINKNITFVSDLSKGNLTDVAECDIAELLRKEVAVISNRYAPQGIKVSLQAPTSQRAHINELALLIVVENLTQNAAQSLEETGGNISVSVRRHRDFHRVEVEDDGVGVPDDMAPKLFTRFATKKTGGMGFGLHYCKIIVDSLRGRIGHTPAKRGALFWVEFPEG